MKSEEEKQLKKDIRWLLTMKTWERTKKALTKTEKIEERLWKWVLED